MSNSLFKILILAKFLNFNLNSNTECKRAILYLKFTLSFNNKNEKNLKFKNLTSNGK